jgi:hypothetical protein
MRIVSREGCRVASLSVLVEAALAVAACAPFTALAAELSLPGYEQRGGALTVRLDGESVDPYFAGKALLAALDARLDSTQVASAWIKWILPFQRPDGGFDRLCRRGERYEPCAAADADDATLAIWMELLARFAPGNRMPPPWELSFQKAARLLASLRDPQSGVYRISPTSPVSLFMDNVEIDEALHAVAGYEHRAGHAAAARAWSKRAEELHRGIERVFQEPDGTFRVSTQEVPSTDFYPYEVAQIFPLTADIVRETAASRYAQWMERYRDRWLEQGKSDYPWALVALVAERRGDRDTVRCWRARALQFRHGAHWNILEEALLRAFEARLSPEEALAPACGAH